MKTITCKQDMVGTAYLQVRASWLAEVTEQELIDNPWISIEEHGCPALSDTLYEMKQGEITGGSLCKRFSWKGEDFWVYANKVTYGGRIPQGTFMHAGMGDYTHYRKVEDRRLKGWV